MRAFVFLLALSVVVGCSSSKSSLRDDDPVTEEVNSFWEDGEWQVSSRSVWAYSQPDTEATTVLNQNWSGSDWTDNSMETWTLDERGAQRFGAASVRGLEWSVTGRMRYTYDEDGRKVGALREMQDSLGTVTPSDSLVSTFSEDGLETERQFRRWADGTWQEVLRQTSEYDTRGRETSRLHRASGENGWADQRRWTFTYDAEGQMETSLVEQMEDGAWTPWLNQTYTHDARGNITQIVHDEWGDEAWTPWMRTETRYTER